MENQMMAYAPSRYDDASSNLSKRFQSAFLNFADRDFQGLAIRSDNLLGYFSVRPGETKVFAGET